MGPLTSLRVLELQGIGPGPFACMVLADLGAEILTIARPEPGALDDLSSGPDALGRSRSVVRLDLRDPEGRRAGLDLAANADVLVEGYRPGVTERLGVGPDACLARNSALVYARVTGWGQDGHLAATAGHDINYVALSGVLHQIGDTRPGHELRPPLNVVGDFGGGGMLAVVGILAALWERQRSGRGQVVDAAIVDGTALLAAMFSPSADTEAPAPSGTLLDGTAPFYRTYRTADGGLVAIGAIEPKFFATLLDVLELDPSTLPAQYDRPQWPRLAEAIGRVVASRTRDQWQEAAAGTDACLTPVLTPQEARRDPHLRQRDSFVEVMGQVQPSPAPRFSRSRLRSAEAVKPPAAAPADQLEAWGLSVDRARRFAGDGSWPV